MMDDDDDDDATATATATDEKTRILVVGESSGGGLTAELCQRLLDDNENQTEESKKIPLPVAHLMINPMLDDRTSAHTADDDSSLPPHLVWNHTSNLYAWGAYLGTEHKPGQVEIPNYAAAARRKDMAGLPPAWITVGDLDLFRQESREYIERLQSAGVDTNYEEVEGGFHGMLTMCTGEDETIAKVWSSFQAFGLRYLCV
jgi:acetyl esterase/lipase